MRRLWPDPDPADLDDAALAGLYAPTDRTTPGCGPASRDSSA
jgi:hypothetical protein